MPRLRVEGLTYQSFGPIDFMVDSGECMAVEGPSGSGKTLMLRAIADLDAHEGEVHLADTASSGDAAHLANTSPVGDAAHLAGAANPHEVMQSHTDAPQWRRRVGMLPAESMWWADTVGEHFSAPPDRIAPLVEQLGFTDGVMSWEIARLSTGERQRLALVRLLVNEPEALLLDEPTASLDQANVERVEHVIASYREEHEAPVVWVSHDSAQSDRVAKRRLRLDGGLAVATSGRNVEED
jgi:ABC-type iron transport system FetAB ATPase subunit